MPTLKLTPSRLACIALLQAATVRAEEPPRPAPPAAPVFAVDPISDTSIILGSAVFAGILDLIISTGEVRPQQVAPDFEPSHLLRIDRAAISQRVDPDARSHSNIGFALALGYAAFDSVWSGVRANSFETGLVDGVIYAEALSLTWGVTNLTKIAVRRPRPRAYIDAQAHRDDPNYSNGSTDSSLSFFSGHASMTASASATATYLAFARSPGTAWPWATLAAGTALTTYVSVERVRAGAHFPTDVIAGSIAGAGIGLLVAHRHHLDGGEPRRLWIGFEPEGSGGVARVGGVF